ncbi:MAG: YfiR family protein [Planctomycetota bacterium]
MRAGTIPPTISSRRPRGRARARRGWIRTILSALLSLSVLTGATGPDPLPVPQTEKEAREIAAIKAALMYKFVKFVEWPATRFAERTSPIVVGVIGKDPFGTILDQTFAGKEHDKRPFVVRRYEKVEDISACHILFVAQSEKKQLERIAGAVQGRSVLLVGDWPDFATLGGIVNFYLESTRNDDGTESVKVKFEINADEAKAQKIKISSQLLKLARPVKKKGQEGEE